MNLTSYRIKVHAFWFLSAGTHKGANEYLISSSPYTYLNNNQNSKYYEDIVKLAFPDSYTLKTSVISYSSHTSSFA